MALRRLLSGWLIAMAAMARSMAAVLERVAADRSEPTPDPVPGSIMAALAERYPGAPAHWLAHVAERTAELAETGAAPLSLASQEAAWPPSLPGAAGPLEPLLPTPPAGDGTIGHEPARPVALAFKGASFQGDAVPTLAALQGRASEVWRRPPASPRRRSRPVFASLAPVAAPANARSSTEGAAPVERRSRLTMTSEGRPPSAPSAPPVDAPSLVPPPSDVVARDRVRSEATPGGAEKSASGPGETPITTRPADRFEPRAPGAHAPPRSPSVARFGEASAAASTIREPRAFEPPVFERRADRASLGASRPADRARRDDHQRLSRPPARPPARRSIFWTLAALVERLRGAPAPGRQTAREHARSAGETPVVPRTDSAAPTAPTAIFPEVARPAPPPRHAMALEKDGRPIRHGPLAVMPPAPRRPSPRPSWAGALANDEAARGQHPHFAIDRPPSTRGGAPRTVDPSTDERWPRFPPTVFTPPPVAEIPSPRLDQLAREQEEGRWSV